MWQFICCEVQGIGHKKSQIPCQDKTLKLMKNDVYVIALADGAGSAKFSHYGAECVVHKISEYMVEHFLELLNCNDGQKVKKEIVDMLITNLAYTAKIHSCKLYDLSSTLLLAAVYKDYFILVHIGDGIIGYLDGNELKVASMPDNGEFFNITTFVTSNDALSSMRIFKGALKDKNAFVLMSDGAAQSFYYKTNKTLAQVIKKLMHRTCLIDSKIMTKQLEEAFNSVVLNNTSDDCSIAILARPSKYLCPITELKIDDRRLLYRISNLNHNIKKQMLRYDTIIALTGKKKSLKQIAQYIHLKPKYTKKYIDKLISLGLMKKEKNLYQRF